jgi:hypothetical protein
MSSFITGHLRQLCKVACTPLVLFRHHLMLAGIVSCHPRQLCKVVCTALVLFRLPSVAKIRSKKTFRSKLHTIPSILENLDFAFSSVFLSLEMGMMTVVSGKAFRMRFGRKLPVDSLENYCPWQKV